MKFLSLSKYFQKIESVSSRNEMTEILLELYRSLSLNELQIVSYLLQGRVSPLFIPAEFHYSEKSLMNVLTNVSGIDVGKVRDKVGDIGDAVVEVLEPYSSKYTVEQIYDSLWELINTAGTGSVTRMGDQIMELLNNMSSVEQKFFSRIVCGKLRLGLNVKTVLDMYSFYISGDKSVREELDRAYGVASDVGYIGKLVFGDREKAIKNLSKVKVMPGVPVRSRLVERVKSFDEVIERLGEKVFLQPKYDGLRCQIHKSSKGFKDMIGDRIWNGRLQEQGDSLDMFSNNAKEIVRLFTRNLEDVTEMFPEIVESTKQLKCKSCVLDSEVVGWDEKKKTFKTYQETMTRRRKYGVESQVEDVPVKAFLFDLGYLDGKDITSIDTSKRLDKLGVLMQGINNDLVLSETLEVSSAREIKKEFNRWVGMGLEGLIAKMVDGGYKPGERNFEWIKMKKSMEEKLVDSVDLVVMGYYYGSGKRAKFGIGALLGGVYNKKEDRFESVTKIGTGITDEVLEIASNRLGELKVSDAPKSYYIEDSLKPDIYVSPEVVISVEADEITQGIVNTQDSPGGGLSLRFPRLIEFDRDKLPEDATSKKELEDMFGLT